MTVTSAARAVVLGAVRAGYITFINTTKPLRSITEVIADAVIEALIDTGWTPPDEQ